MKRGRMLCDHCAAAQQGNHASGFSPAEWVALCSTKLLGTRERLPVIRAILLPYRGRAWFAGMPRAELVEWETPAFRCPWSPLELPPVLRHGPSYRSVDGRYAGTLDLDEYGCFHRASHCPAYEVSPSGSKQMVVSEGYFIEPFTDPSLPRREIALW
jgi:hypothetical protein